MSVQRPASSGGDSGDPDGKRPTLQEAPYRPPSRSFGAPARWHARCSSLGRSHWAHPGEDAMRTTKRSTSTFLALAMILRADGEDDDRAGVNAPIFPGDTVRTAGDQRVEVQLAAGTLVRLDRGSAVVFQSMPDPYAKFQDNVILALRAGAIPIPTRLGQKDEFRIDTDAGSVYLLGDGDFRIETDGQGRTTVASLRGVAEVVGSEGSVLVRGGSRTAVSAGSVPQDPRGYSAFASDGFDRWCEI